MMNKVLKLNFLKIIFISRSKYNKKDCKKMKINNIKNDLNQF